ncbi:uncharacterized protein CANTADRAFT_47954 [Suhomyces tanzawaensis NRRL Y-17324]|uniref:N-acetylglucosamine-induced protein 1 n=1 Tax=Suhomyces tanzawaensis NRRL Y-17324 TaxID=984487 RepID=A0A1E4SNA8_9ASCO|nr:uncharacterized protein CANTADRAFT_47954 [Suhomyces tanzawaensis NRRL Y-17324]ODV80872.1 hypothetical protein CANTADRAFT_47954 [Suhomyces tanzawaensis NRRL Y-17324]
MSYLHTPPTTPVATTHIEALYKQFNIKIVHHHTMPNPSKVKKTPFSWLEIRYIISTNQLELFARSQEATDRYLKFKQHLKDQNVGIMDHVLNNELQWDAAGLRTGDSLFTNPQDLKIIYNQFPYYVPHNVKHFCVWTKVRICGDPNSPIGDILPQTRDVISRYVEKTFVEKYGLSWDQIVWFRNWDSLQSVKSISHIHVIVKDLEVPDEEIIGTSGSVLTEEEYNTIMGKSQ